MHHQNSSGDLRNVGWQGGGASLFSYARQGLNILVLLFQLEQKISLVKTKIIWLIKVEMQFML